MFDNPIETNDVPEQFVALRARLKRDSILQATVDRVNPVRYNTLTSEQQAQLAAYRQALLDVPAQAGFPTAIEWPIKPQWL